MLRINTQKSNLKKRYPTKILVGLLICTPTFAVTAISSVYLNNGNTARIAYADTSSASQSLVPGNTINTGNQDYQTSDIENGVAWTTAGSASAPVSNQTFATTLVANTKQSAGLALFRGALDMTKAVSFSGTFSISANAQGAMNGGDSLGFILTPEAIDQIASNLPNSTGEYLGIKGLISSVFLGRDLYYNGGFDTQLDGMTDGVDTICIRATDASGNLEPLNQYTIAAAPDNGDSITETMSFSWMPQTINSNGTTTGILNYTVTPETGSPISISRTETLADSLSLGVIGATGGNTSTMTFQNNGSAFIGAKGTSPVTVNYIDQKTENEISNAAPSTIIANVGDTLGVVAPSTDAQAVNQSYTYHAPLITGYEYVSSDPMITVGNNDTAANTLDVYYKPAPVNTVINVTVDKDDTQSGNLLTDTTGYIKISSNTHSVTTTTDAEGDSTTTVTTTNIWHKPMNTINTIIINLDESGNSLRDTSGEVQVDSKQTTITSTPEMNGDTITTVTITNIWHKPINTIVNRTINKLVSGKILSDTTGYIQVSSSKSSTTSDPGENGDTTTIITITNIWKKGISKNHLPSVKMPIKVLPTSPAGKSAPHISALISSENLSSEEAATTNSITTIKKAQGSKSQNTRVKSKTTSKSQSQFKTKQTKEKGTLSEKTNKHQTQTASSTMTPRQKVVQILKVESAGAGGGAAGMAISGGLWFLVQRFIPAGFFAFLIGKSRKKKDKDNEK